MDAAAVERFLRARPPGQATQGRIALGMVVGEWRVQAYLGMGRFAEVYRVVNTRTGREGALKLLIDDSVGMRERFLVEMDTIRFLRAGAFPAFYGDGDCGGRPYYVMEYLQPCLMPMPRREVPEFMVAVAKAVQRLHTAGYVHRDLKPANILRRRNGQPVLIDLGLVKRLKDVAEGTHPSPLSVVDGKPMGVGTIGFAAPEQLIKGEASARSDVFSLGKVLDACYGGRPPGPMREIVLRATQESPAHRYATADDFARAIRRRNHPRVLAACASLAAAAAVVVAVAMWPRAEQPTPIVIETVPDESLTSPEALLQQPDESEQAHLQRLLPMAERGNVAAQLLVAEAYFYARGTEKNQPKAVEWYRRAAAAENHDAEASLGVCSLYGWGCEKSHEAAFYWFSRAADGGNVSAIGNLAYCYMQGFGVDRDVDEAFRLAQTAAVRGCAPAQTMLGECYFNGWGTDKDLAKAETWFRAAALQGNRRAKDFLASHFDADSILTSTEKRLNY